MLNNGGPVNNIKDASLCDSSGNFIVCSHMGIMRPLTESARQGAETRDRIAQGDVLDFKEDQAVVQVRSATAGAYIDMELKVMGKDEVRGTVGVCGTLVYMRRCVPLSIITTKTLLLIHRVVPRLLPRVLTPWTPRE